MYNKTLAASMLMLCSSAVLADDSVPMDLSSFVPSLREAVLQDGSDSFDRPAFTADLGLGQQFYLHGNVSNLDTLDAQRTPHFIDDFAMEIEKYSMGIGYSRALSPSLNLNASVDVVHLDYTSELPSYLSLDGSDSGKSLGLGLTSKPSDNLELGAQWSVTRYDGDPLRREFNNVDIRATYKFTPNFGLFTQYGVGDDVNGDGQLEDQYRVGGRISF